MLKAYKYRIYPTDEQKSQLNGFFGCARFVYNLGLETKIAAWVSAKKKYSCIDLTNQMVDLKNTEASWLSKCPSQALQMSLRNLDNAYTHFFRGGGFPKFKNKHSKQSIQFPQGVRVDFNNSIIFIPKLKEVSVIFHRQFKGNVKTVTISKTVTNKYFVSILVDGINESVKIKQNEVVGIDLGIKTLATLSDGTKFENPKFLSKSLKRLRIEQRTLSRRSKTKGKNYEKQRLVVAKLHEKIKNQREDYLHKISTLITKKHDIIVMEKLDTKEMMGERNFGRIIGEIGWRRLKTMIEYKCAWSGKDFIEIGQFEPSSKCCSSCGKINRELKLSDREWACINCGVIHDRDINAAINIKNFGLRDKPLSANAKRVG